MVAFAGYFQTKLIIGASVERSSGIFRGFFDEGEFQATYKYALLLTLAELAVEHGVDAGGEIDLPMQLVAEKFAEFYWRKVAPYAVGSIVNEGINWGVSKLSGGQNDSRP